MLESRANSFEMETLVEAFYYFAFRLRQVIQQLPDLNNFECKGVRNVRNKLLEHPEGADSGVNGSLASVTRKLVVSQGWWKIGNWRRL